MRFEKRVFKSGELVTLDYNEFIECTFDGCSMHFGGGQYQIIECKFLGAIQFTFHDSAQRTLMYLKMLSSACGGAKFLEAVLAGIGAPPPMKLN